MHLTFAAVASARRPIVRPSILGRFIGLVVAVRPQFGGYLVAAWLAGIIVNLLMMDEYYDIALRDFGLLLAAVALARIAVAFPRHRPARADA